MPKWTECKDYMEMKESQKRAEIANARIGVSHEEEASRIQQILQERRKTDNAPSMIRAVSTFKRAGFPAMPGGRGGKPGYPLDDDFI